MTFTSPPWDCVHSGTCIIEGTEGHDIEIGSGSADDESGDINIFELPLFFLLLRLKILETFKLFSLMF